MQQVRRQGGLYVLRAAKDRTTLQNRGRPCQRRSRAREYILGAVGASELQGALSRCVRVVRDGDIWLDPVAVSICLRAPFSSHVSVRRESSNRGLEHRRYHTNRGLEYRRHHTAEGGRYHCN